MKATQRLYLTADRKAVVALGDKRAATLYCVPGDEIPQSACDRFKLVDGGLKGGSKEDKGGSDKERKGGEDKGGQGGGSPELPPATDDLSKIAGVGAKTAEALAKAGLATFAAVAAIDPAAPPAVEGLPAVFNWDAVKASAAALVPAPAEG